MRSLLLFLLLLAFSFGDSIHKVARINAFSAEAAEAYESHNYLQAIAAYEYLLDSLHLQDDKMQLNLAHAYFRSGDFQNAQTRYEALTRHPNNLLRSMACQQLGTLYARRQKWGPALDFYRQALVTNPNNEQARHNYELVKKYLLLHPEELESEEEENPAGAPEAPEPAPAPGAGGPGGQKPGEGGTAADQEGQSADGPERNERNSGGSRKEQGETNSQQENPAGPDQQEGRAGEEPGSSLGQSSAPEAAPAGPGNRGGTENVTDQDREAQTIQRLRQMNLSPEKAQMLLEALRQAETQHLQQLPRKAGKPKDSSKPDW